jgi:hypothetical protein
MQAPCGSLELAEKINNYLNIWWMDKSSEPPPQRVAGFKSGQMRGWVRKDAGGRDKIEGDVLKQTGGSVELFHSPILVLQTAGNFVH